MVCTTGDRNSNRADRLVTRGTESPQAGGMTTRPTLFCLLNLLPSYELVSRAPIKVTE